MINKTEFVKVINRLKNYNDLQNKIDNLFYELIDNKENDFCNAGSVCIGHETIVVQLLENMFNDYFGIISWWMYDLDYGRKYIHGCAQDKNGRNIDLSTPSKLYDFLISNMNDENEIKKTT